MKADSALNKYPRRHTEAAEKIALSRMTRGGGGLHMTTVCLQVGECSDPPKLQDRKE